MNRPHQLRSPRIFAVFLVSVLAVHQASQADVSFVRNVIYGHKAGMALTYDVIQPAEANGGSVLFLMSGGWFSSWQPVETRVPWMQFLLDQEYTVAVIHHGSAPQFKVPDAVADVRRAVRHYRMTSADYGVDPDRIAVMGGSAGGHLCLMLALASDAGDEAAEDPVLQTSNRIQACVAYYPPVELTNSVGPNERFPALEFDPELGPEVSPINFVSEDDPPVLLVHGDQDRLVPISNSERMHAALNAVDVPNRFVTIEGAGHGWRKPEDRETVRTAVVAFLQEHL